MRIALIHNLPKGGARRNTYEQVKGLARRGHIIFEYSFSSAERDYLPITSFISSSQIYPLHWIQLKSVAIRGVSPYLHILTNVVNILRLDWISRRIAREIDRQHYDIAFVTDCRYLMIPLVLRHLRTPTLLYLNTILDRHRSDTSAKIRKENHFYYQVSTFPVKVHKQMVHSVQKISIKHARRVLTNSYFTQKDYLETTGVNSFVVYPGVDTSMFTPTKIRPGAYVLSVGSLNQDKGHAFIIEAVGLIPERKRPTVVVATMDSDDIAIQNLFATAEACQVALEFRKAETSQEMAAIYTQARLLAFAPRTESFGLVAIEAMSCGIPVVGVDEGGLREIIQDGISGYLVPRDAQKFAVTIQKILDDNTLFRNLGMGGRKVVEEKWTWQLIIDDLERHLLSVALG